MSFHRFLLPLARRSLLPSFRSPSVGAVDVTPAVSLTPAELDDAASLTPELAAEVVARMAGRLPMPVTRKVTAFVSVEQLRRALSAPALAAVLALAGLRHRPAEGMIKLPVDRHPTADANRAAAVLLMGQLLRAAKASVGEPLADEGGIQGGWAGLAAEVGQQAERDEDDVSVGLLALAADDWREIQASRRAKRG
ncbi:hypothetical protein I4F81_002971 [Pyropia yezoensis]|uniref:Uncharacterized protein n=1 Tax=Pyropia yezoensis TaxID=2788 RepID=A0ACC3BS98_PYRYE|nr:hypothetical protein I4F81_002971 [Neopyropia yezoensis]